MTANGNLTAVEVDEILAERLAYHLEGKRIAASLACPDCLSLCGEGVCLKHDKNADYLEQDQ